MVKKSRLESSFEITHDILHIITPFLHITDRMSVKQLSNYYNCFFIKYKLYKAIHLIYVIDTTASMVSYATEFTKKISKLNKYLSNLDIKYSLVEFGDHTYPYDKTICPTTTHTNITSYKHINNLINDIDFEDGGDIPEAIADALHETTKLILHKNLNVVIYLSDTYPHGFYKEEDAYPHGCPCKLDYNNEINKLKQPNIKFIYYNLDLNKSQEDLWYIEHSLKFRKTLLQNINGVLISKYIELKNYILTNI